jgi:hypothetical protein
MRVASGFPHNDREVGMPNIKQASSRCATALGVGLLMTVAAAPVQAEVIDRGTFVFSETNVADNVCGIDLVRDTTLSSRFRVRVDKASDGQAFFQLTRFEFTDTFTNPLNGRSMTFEGHELTNEIKATHVAGDVYEFTSIEAGQPFTVRDAAGRVVLRDRGVIRHRVVFDTLGDNKPGGVTLEESIVAVSGPHPGLEQSEDDFCAMVTELVG